MVIVQVGLAPNVQLSQQITPPQIDWVYRGLLARSCRPCYHDETPSRAGVGDWMELAGKMGIRSILCLLSNDELREYFNADGTILLGSYCRQGFQVAHVPVPVYREPRLENGDYGLIRDALDRLEAPLLVHCGNGNDRTGDAVQFIRKGNAIYSRKASDLIGVAVYLEKIGLLHHPRQRPEGEQDLPLRY